MAEKGKKVVDLDILPSHLEVEEKDKGMSIELDAFGEEVGILAHKYKCEDGWVVTDAVWIDTEDIGELIEGLKEMKKMIEEE